MQRNMKKRCKIFIVFFHFVDRKKSLCYTFYVVITLKRKKFELYDEDLEYYFLVKVETEAGTKFVYNQRTLVHHAAFAKRFETRRSAKRCIALSTYENCEILKIKREK